MTSSRLYRWTFGLLVKPVDVPPAPGHPPSPPSALDQRALSVYHTLNAFQLVVLSGLCLWSLRWVYADSRADNAPHRFWIFLVMAFATNLAVYFVARQVISGLTI